MVLPVLFWFFYAAAVILWFKNSFPLIKEIPVSPLIPFAGFLLVTVILLIRRFGHYSRPFFRFSRQKALILLILLIIAAGIRIPWFLNGYGVNTSDDAITMLMAKHIAEGKLPPVYYYGQLYQGSLYSHITALFILIFGYSHLLMQISIFIFYLGFIAIQFYLIDRYFSLSLAAAAAFFYALPIGHLIYLSFFNSAAFPLVLLLGSLILFLTAGAAFKEKIRWIPALGFFWGLAFWTHQISIGFIAASALILFFRPKNKWKKYFRLPLFAALGGLPLIMSEIHHGFPLMKFLLPSGQKQGGNVFLSSFKLMAELIVRQAGTAGYIILLIVFAGSLVFLIPSFKSKKFQPQSMFSLFFFIFCLIFFLSGFSHRNLVRYLFPLYFCIPLLLLGVFESFRFRLKSAAMFLTVLVIFFGWNLKETKTALKEVKSAHQQNKCVIKFMKNSGKRYWRGDYWTAYLLTALSDEEIIVDSFSINRYLPYRLRYDNQAKTENFVFSTREKESKTRMPDRFSELLDSFDVMYKKRKLKGCTLIYDINSPVYPGALLAPVHPEFAFPELSKAHLSQGFLDMTVVNSGAVMGSDYWIKARIPGYSSEVTKFPAAKEEKIVSIPAPDRNEFPVVFHLNYKGLKMAGTETRFVYEDSQTEERKRSKKIAYLSGFGMHPTINGRKMRVCYKQSQIEIKPKPKGTEKVQLHLYSPFNFNDFRWYGDYHQELCIQIDGETKHTFLLHPGENTVSFFLPETVSENSLARITLNLKYHSFFDFAPYEKTSALLTDLTIIHK